MSVKEKLQSGVDLVKEKVEAITSSAKSNLSKAQAEAKSTLSSAQNQIVDAKNSAVSQAQDAVSALRGLVKKAKEDESPLKIKNVRSNIKTQIDDVKSQVSEEEKVTAKAKACIDAIVSKVERTYDDLVELGLKKEEAEKEVA